MASLTSISAAAAAAAAASVARSAPGRLPARHKCCSLVWGNRNRTCNWDKKMNAGVVRIADDDIEDQFDDEIESTLDILDEGADTDEISVPDIMAPFAAAAAAAPSEGDEEAEGATGETLVDYKINEDEFHKISLYDCDFFIRKVPDLREGDANGDVYDFREMYVSPPDTDVYSIPKVCGKMPQQKTRCSKGKYNEICLVRSEDMNNPRAPMGKNEFHVMKVFLIKHLYNRPARAKNFVLNFEKVYILDGKTKSIRKAKVKVDVPGGKDRDRTQEILIVRDKGTTFRIIPKEERKSKDQIIEEYLWKKTRVEMEDFLKGFRDFQVSNWF